MFEDSLTYMKYHLKRKLKHWFCKSNNTFYLTQYIFKILILYKRYKNIFGGVEWTQSLEHAKYSATELYTLGSCYFWDKILLSSSC